MAHIAWREVKPRIPNDEPEYQGLVGNMPLFSVYYKPSLGRWVASGNSLIDIFAEPKSASAAKTACEAALTRFVRKLGADFTEPTVISWMPVDDGFDGYLGTRLAYEIRRQKHGYRHFDLYHASDSDGAGYRPAFNSCPTAEKAMNAAQRLVKERKS
jgi:hypothetical protein